MTPLRPVLGDSVLDCLGNVDRPINGVKWGWFDRPARLSRSCFSRFHSFVLTSKSYKDRPFLNVINGGSFKISLKNVFFSIKCHSFMIICFKLDTDGWYCVTKGKIRLFSLRFCWRASFLSPKLTSESVYCIKCFGGVFWSFWSSSRFQTSCFSTFWLTPHIIFNFRLEKVGKGNCHFSTHGGAVCLQIVFSVKLEGIFLWDKP